MNQFSFEQRTANLRQLALAEDVYDLLIIGGGITGAGVARDAASRGMKVVLVEARDFAEGTSSRSSKLIHGGIRYLENLEFGLVFEALQERGLLFEMAPHLVHPLRFMLPLFKNSRVSMFKMGLGMWLYDALALFDAPEMHERLSAEATLRRMPVLRSHDLEGSFVYSDAYMDDDRLVIETLRSAHRLGAICVNHVSARSAQFTQGKVSAVQCRDELTGREFSVKAKHVISTVGPWTDELGHKLLGEWRSILRPSKGIHLTLDRSRLPLKEAVVMAAEDQKRIVFGIPRHEMIIIGTTDTYYQGDPADVHSDREDVDYLLKIVDLYFPGAKISEADILASYAGVRPLVHDGSETESKTSREHVILCDERNITFVAGGKYTTYRHMAQETVDKALQSFPLEDRARFHRSNTKVPLNPLATPSSFLRCRSLANEWAEEFGLSLQEVQLVCERHGEEAEHVLAYSDRLLGLRKHPQRIWLMEAHHAIDQTMCLTLKDFYLRRSPLFLAFRDHGLSLLNHLSNIFTERLSWSDAEQKSNMDALRKHFATELGWMKNQSGGDKTFEQLF